MRKALHYLWQILSNLLVLYGFYLIYLFIYDTLIRIMERGANVTAAILTVLGLIIYILFQLRKYLPPFKRKIQ